MLRKIKKKHIVMGAIVVTMFVIGLIWGLRGRGREEKPGVTPTVPAAPTSAIFPGVTRPFTGEKELMLPREEAEAINAAFELRERLPVETEEFRLDYDYKEAKFVVELKDPQGRGRDFFRRWLEREGFGDIVEEEFEYR